MERRLFQELRAVRRRFAALCALLLVLPLLFSLAPRPNEANAAYVSALTGYTLCTPTEESSTGTRQILQSPCEDCLAGGQCPVCTAIIPQILAVLTPERIVSGTLQPQAKPLQSQFLAAVHAARGPPILI